MDLLEKCRQFYDTPERARSMGYPANPRMLHALGLYPYFLPIERREGPEAVMGGRRVLMLGSNDYLGLSCHPQVQEAAARAVFEHGTACTGSRFLNGTLDLHLQLERRLAHFVGKEAALVFTTGYQASLGTIGALVGKDDVVIADRDVHASVIDGIRLTDAVQERRARFFRHNDVAHLERILASVGQERGRLVVVDGVFSMGGDIAPLPEIAAACRRHGARLMVDDAHGIGVLGGGRGTAFELGCQDEVDLVLGTFSKSLASTGGFVAGSKETLQWIQHFARPFIFSASLSPSQVAAVLAALDVLEREPDRPARALRNAERLRAGLSAGGFDTKASRSPIIPVVIGDQFRTVQVWRELLKAGVYTNVALPPAVPPDASLLRTSVMATHTDDHIATALERFRAVRERLGRAVFEKPSADGRSPGFSSGSEGR